MIISTHPESLIREDIQRISSWIHIQTEIEAEASEIQRARNQLTEDKASIQERYTQLVEKVVALKNEQTELQREFDRLRQDAREARDKVEELERQKKLLERDLDHGPRIIEEIEGSIARLSSDTSKQDQVEQMRRRKEELESEIKNAPQKLENITQQIEKAVPVKDAAYGRLTLRGLEISTRLDEIAPSLFSPRPAGQLYMLAGLNQSDLSSLEAFTDGQGNIEWDGSAIPQARESRIEAIQLANAIREVYETEKTLNTRESLNQKARIAYNEEYREVTGEEPPSADRLKRDLAKLIEDLIPYQEQKDEIVFTATAHAIAYNDPGVIAALNPQDGAAFNPDAFKQALEGYVQATIRSASLKDPSAIVPESEEKRWVGAIRELSDQRCGQIKRAYDDGEIELPPPESPGHDNL